MKTISLILTWIAFSYFTFGQVQEVDLHSNLNLAVKTAPKGRIQNSSVTSKAPGEVFWSETFDSNRWAVSVDPATNTCIDTSLLPDGWTVYDGNNLNFFWHWSQLAPRGRYTSYDGINLMTSLQPSPDAVDWLYSTTADDGIMMLESDYFNTDQNGEMVADFLGMDSYIMTPPINVSGRPGVGIRFQERFRYCCNSTNTISLFVSTDYDPYNPDAASWTEFNAKNGVLVNQYALANPDIIDFNISSVTNGASQIYIKWQQIGASHYVWMIDDIEIYEPYQNNLVLLNAWADYLYMPASEVTNDQYYSGGYTFIPRDIAGEFIQFRGAVNNFGINDQNIVTMNVKVIKNGNEEQPVYDNTSPAIALTSGTTDTCFVSTNYTPSGMGVYKIKYQVSSENTDQFPDNNSDEYNFEVSNNLYARNSMNPDNFSTVTPGNWVGGDVEGSRIGILFDIPGNEPVTISSVATYISTINDSIRIANGDFNIIGYFMGINTEGMYIPIAQTDLYTLTLADRGTFITVPFRDDGNLLIQPGTYYVNLEFYTNTPNGEEHVDFYIGNDLTVPFPTQSNGNWVCTIFTNDWGWIAANPVIALNIVPTLANVTFHITDGTSIISNAVVTFNGITNAPGNYVFNNIVPGTYDYTITKPGYNIASGTITVSDADVEQNIVLIPLSDLFFSEYIEGTGNSKAIEIYNPNFSPVDLSGYSVKLAYNGTGWSVLPEYIHELSGTIAGGDVYILYATGADSAIITVGDWTAPNGTSVGQTQLVYFDGNDALGLFKDDVLVDAIGYPNVNDTIPCAGIPQAGEDHSFVRKFSVKQGNTDWNSSAGTDPINSEWQVFPVNTFQYLGFHCDINAAEILTFTLASQTGEASLNSNEATVNIEVGFGTDLTTLTPILTVSPGAQVSPTSGSLVNFMNPVIYTVTAANEAITKDWTVTVSLQQVYTVIFSVSDGTNAINDALITLGNITNPAGNYVFENVAPGTYDYYIVRSGYYTIAGTATVINANVSASAIMTLIGYLVIFDVSDGVNAITNAVVTFNGVSNSAGDYVFASIIPGTYDFSVVKNGFNTSTGSITVSNTDVIQNVIMTPIGYTVIFNISDGTNAITDAIITFDGVAYPAGNYVFINILPGTYNYTVSKSGYFDVPGVVTVVNSNVTVNVTMTGTPQLITDRIRIAPNPFCNELILTQIKNMDEIVIADLTGRYIIRIKDNLEPQITINTSGLAKGIYYLAFYEKNRIKGIKKIVKQ